jgi:hypothetical protein
MSKLKSTETAPQKCLACGAPLRVSLHACPLCGTKSHADDIPHELLEAARRHLEEPKEEPNPLPFLSSASASKLLAVVGIPIGLMGGVIFLILSFILPFVGVFIFLASGWIGIVGIFGVGFVIAMGAWLLAFRIWPFNQN